LWVGYPGLYIEDPVDREKVCYSMLNAFLFNYILPRLHKNSWMITAVTLSG